MLKLSGIVGIGQASMRLCAKVLKHHLDKKACFSGKSIISWAERALQTKIRDTNVKALQGALRVRCKVKGTCKISALAFST